MERNNTKVMLLQTQLYIVKNQRDNALQNLSIILSLEPDNKKAKLLFDSINQREKENNESKSNIQERTGKEEQKSSLNIEESVKGFGMI